MADGVKTVDSAIDKMTATVSKIVAAAIKKDRSNLGKNARSARGDERMKADCIEIAKKSWKENKDERLGEMAKYLLSILKPTGYGMRYLPTVETVKGWIQPSAPSSARRPGAPRKIKHRE